MKPLLLPTLALTALCLTGTLPAQVPQLLNYQGRVTAGTVNFDGPGQFKFALVNGAGTATFWSNDGTSVTGSQPAAAVTVAVTKGLYSVLLGDATLPNMTIVPPTVFTNADVRLRVWFNDGAAGFQLLSPDQRIAAVGYALMAGNIADGAITSAKIAPGAVQAGNLASGIGGTWQVVAGTTLNAQANTSYVATSASATSVALPSNATIGDVVQVSGAGPGGWTVSASPGQVISAANGVLSSQWTPRESNRNWASVASSADGSKLVAVVDNGRIYTSTNFGGTWMARDSSRSWQNVASSDDGTKLLAAAFNGQLFTSADSGLTWTARESSRTWVGVASSANGAKLVSVVYGGQIFTSTDSGVTWTPRATARNWQNVASSSDGAKLAAIVDGGQIYTSIDSGISWTPRESNRSWRGIASSADGANLVATATGGQVYTSIDSGVTWTARDSVRSWRGAASSANGAMLAAVVTGGQIYTSADAGATWTARDANRAWISVAASSDGTRLSAAVYGGQLYISSPVVSGSNGESVALQFLGNGQWTTLEQTQIAAGAVTSNTIAAGAVGSSQIAAGAVGGNEIAPGSVGAAQLAKPPRSGSIASSTLNNTFDHADFSVLFNPDYAVAPNVTLAMNSSSPDIGGNSVLFIKSRTAAAFTGSWRIPPSPVALAPIAFRPVSLGKIDNGRPAIVVVPSVGPAALQFVLADDALGSAWGEPVNVVASGSVLAPSLEIVNGRPAIAFTSLSVFPNGLRHSVHFVRATSSTGSSWGPPELASTDLTLDFGSSVRLHVVNGNPAIIFQDWANQDLYYVRAANVDGTAWGTRVLVDATVDAGGSMSLALVNGNPAISYAGDGKLKYVRASDATGSAWGAPVLVDPVLVRGASLSIVNGRPAIAYGDDTNGVLRFVRATDASGFNWAAPVDLEANGSDPAMVIVNGNPAIAYVPRTTPTSTGPVRFVRAANISGTTWGPPVTIGMAGDSPSSAIISEAPAVAYTLDGAIRFVRQKTTPADVFDISWIALEP